MTQARFTGKVALVCGGARGIGAATARRFATEGAAVVVADVLEHEARETVLDIGRTGGQALFVPCDVSHSPAVQAVVREAVNTFGGIDVLFNNVGIARAGKVDELSESDWDVTLGTNLRGMFLACKFAVPEMRKRGGGAIVNMASAMGHASLASSVSYSASKGAVLALTRSIAIDHAPEGIRCNSVSPGTVDTPLVRAALGSLPAAVADELLKGWGRVHPVGRIGKAEEVAAVVTFLASSDAAFVTGADFRVDGGLLAGLAQPQRV